MKMKKVIILVSMVGIFAFLPDIQSHISSTIYSNWINSKDVDPIELKGDLPAPSGIRSFSKPVQVLKNDYSLQVNFLFDLGMITVSIYDETGSAVYQQSVTTYAGQQVFIDISSLDAGEYTIEFVNSQNKYLSGMFEI